MKKSILFAVVGLVAIAVQSFGAGTIRLDNYSTSGPYVTYGVGGPGQAGAGLGADFTAGLYYALGDITGFIAADPSGVADPSSLGALTLGTGLGSTASFYTSTFHTPGTFYAITPFSVPGTSDAGGDTITLVIVAYQGATYATAVYRAHSTPFTMMTSASSSPNQAMVGNYMPAFGLYVIPEPVTLAVGGTSLATLLLFRRKLA